MHLDGLWGCLCRVIGATRSVYVLGSERCPLFPQNNALVLRRAPKRADPDQPTALSLASVGGRNLDAEGGPRSFFHLMFGPTASATKVKFL